MYLVWCLALVLSNLLVGKIISWALSIPDGNNHTQNLTSYFGTTLLTLPLATPIAFFAIWGKGYLAPLGFVALTLVFSQIIAATGYGNYFPWSIPGLYSGAGGQYKSLLNIGSYSMVLITFLVGYAATILYWIHADQTK
jgi:hypothetical protein